MTAVPKGLADKIYWRQVGGGWSWHAFKRLAEQFKFQGKTIRYGSLCGSVHIERSGGQDCRRPYALMRCGRCDNLEMQRRGWEESWPESPSFLELHEHKDE